MPSAASGSSPVSMRPTCTGQPERNATEVHLAPSHLKPPVAHVPGSEEQPSALIAYTRLLPNSSSPVLPSTPSEAVLMSEALISPSLPCPEMYSSLVPTMIVGGLPGPARLATAGVSTILPWSSFLSSPAGTFELNV